LIRLLCNLLLLLILLLLVVVDSLALIKAIATLGMEHRGSIIISCAIALMACIGIGCAIAREALSDEL
jgi:hypothetical protein